jgi:hypothetical protein
MAARKKTTTAKKTTRNSTLAVFELMKSTKNTHRMQEINASGEPISGEDGAAVGSLYLQKGKFGDTAPKKIRVEITVIG